MKKTPLRVASILLILAATGNVACNKAPPPKRARPPGQTAGSLVGGGGGGAGGAARVPIMKPEEIQASCDRAVRELAPRVDSFVKQAKSSQAPAKGSREISDLENLDRMFADFSMATHKAISQQYLNEDQNAREKASACAGSVQAALATQLAREDLHDRVKDIRAEAGESALKEAFLARMIEAGAKLSADQQKQLREKQKRLAALERTYETNLVNPQGERFELTEEQLKDAPESLKHRTRMNANGRGPITIGFTRSDSSAMMELMPSSAVRKAYYLKSRIRGSEANSRILPEMLKLRLEIAKLHGKRSYAELMAAGQEPGSIASTLTDMRNQIFKKVETDLEALRRYDREKLDTASTSLGPWDIQYVLSRYRKETFGIEIDKIAAALKRDEVFASVLAAFGQSLGVKIEPAKDAAEAGLREYAVTSGKEVVGTFEAMLATRLEFPLGATVIPIRARHLLPDGKEAAPSAVLFINYNGGMSLAQVSQLIHETAHLMHHLLYAGKHATLSGLAAGAGFREIPAKTIQNWAYEKDVLKAVAKLSDEQAQKLAEARSFNRPYQILKEIFAARLDLAIHGEGEVDVAKEATRLHKEIYDQELEYAGIPAISRLNGSLWAAAWSEGTAAALYAPFAGKPLDSSVGEKFREKILAPGLSQEPAALMRSFLGRDPQPADGLKALLKL